MGAKQSKRSVDISAPPKKGEVETVVEGEGRLEKLEDGDVSAAKATANGTASHADKDSEPVVNGDSAATEPVEEKKTETEEAKTEENKDESLVNGATDSPASPEGDKSTDDGATPDKKKKKDKPKKKWSFRSISFSKKDKSKPNLNKDEAKNGNITKEEPVAEVVEAEAAATTEAIPVKDEEKKDEKSERTEEGEKKKEEKTETTTEAQSTEIPAPVPASPPAPAELAPTPSPAPEPVTAPTPAPEPIPEPITTPAPELVSEPVVAVPEPPVTVEEIPVPEPVVEAKTEPKVEELPPPLPASPPPTEAPPPTPVAPTPAPEQAIPDVTLHTEADTQETEVVGGGESMAEPEDVGPVSDAEDKVEETKEAPLVNGVSHNHKFDEDITEKVDMVTESLKNLVTDSIIPTQVTENSEENCEQTASAAD